MFMTRRPDLQLVDDHLDSPSVLGVRQRVAQEPLAKLHSNNGFGDMLRAVADMLSLDCKLTLNIWTQPGFRDAPLHIFIPNPMPLFGTRQFREYHFTIDAHKGALRHYPFPMITFGLAHELCHLVLFATQHPLHKDELATDLAAMMLGFSEFEIAWTNSKARSALWVLFQRLAVSNGDPTKPPAGYLSYAQIEYAHARILKMRKRPKRR